SLHVPMTNIRPRTITQISSALIPSPPFRDFSRTLGGADRAPDQISACLTRVSSLPEIRASACTDPRQGTWRKRGTESRSRGGGRRLGIARVRAGRLFATVDASSGEVR